MMERVADLRKQIEVAEEKQRAVKRRHARLYGDLFIYDLPAGVDLYWRIGPTDEAAESLIVRPNGEENDRRARAFLPPTEYLDWRWTSPDHATEGGEYLDPGEVIARVPKQFHGWVAVKTHEALQLVRHALYEKTAGTVASGDDLAQVGRLAQRAQHLAGFSEFLGSDATAVMDEADEEPVAYALNPDGRFVRLLPASWEHILSGHPEMEDHLDDVVQTLENPDYREPDPRPGRERFFRRGGPQSWIRVVIEVDGPFDRVVTAFPQVNEPNDWRRS
jgi:hypothetical protein